MKKNTHALLMIGHFACASARFSWVRARIDRAFAKYAFRATQNIYDRSNYLRAVAGLRFVGALAGKSEIGVLLAV